MRKLLLAAAAILVFFIILFSSLFSYIYNTNYYDRKYQQHGVYDRFTRKTALNATGNLFGYFRSENQLDMDFFSEQEASHLSDVKQLIQKSQQLYYISITLFWIALVAVYLLARKSFMRFFADMMLYSGIFAAALILIFSLIYLVGGFDFIFIKFHEIFFTGNYAFNPATSNMKALFPDAFFRDLSLTIVFVTFLKAGLLAGAGYFLRTRQLSL